MDGNKIVEIATGVLDKYDVYVVNGKVIVIRENALDLDDDGDVKEISALSSQLYENKFLPAIHGKDTICVLGPMDNHEYAVSMTHITNLPVGVRLRARDAAYEYWDLQGLREMSRIPDGFFRLSDLYEDNQITDIDGYVHVINGKVICFKPDVYDLNKPEDVEDLLAFAGRLYVDPWLKPMYGDQTMCYLNKLPDGSIYHGMGDLEVFLINFSEEVQDRIRRAMDEYART